MQTEIKVQFHVPTDVAALWHMPSLSTIVLIVPIAEMDFDTVADPIPYNIDIPTMSKDGKIPGINYFCLTKKRHDAWMQALGRNPIAEHLSEKNVICSKHFYPEDICRGGNRIQLRSNAVPKLGRNGWNNNPTVYQFYYTFRRLCLNIDLKVLKGNCDILDSTKMLTSSNTNEKRNVSPELDQGDITIIKKYEFDYNDLVIEDDEFVYIIDISPSLTLLNENVVTYISGYVVRSITKQIKCTVCLDSLEESNYNALDLQFMLLHRKDRGGLIKPSKDVIQICMYTEKKIAKF
ncbi:hypothetical protein JTB14_028160 [Gonioctena quinquepunctata]|nr:hypothetical protein JTB14_028160 [Gonioctena quinquepunctata]